MLHSLLDGDSSKHKTAVSPDLCEAEISRIVTDGVCWKHSLCAGPDLVNRRGSYLGRHRGYRSINGES